jgi:hypothetical protein
MGNFSLYENKKIIPFLDIEKFEEILQCSEKFSEITYIWDCIKGMVYDNTNSSIGLKENNGKNNYYLLDLSEEEIRIIDEFLGEKGVYLENTRLMKIGHDRYAYLVASQEERMEEWEGLNIIGYYGIKF